MAELMTWRTMPWWLGNPITLSVFVLISTGIALAIGSRRRGEIQFWRTVETAATVLGGVSLLMLSFNVEHFFASRYFEGFRQAYVGASWLLTSHADFVSNYMCKTKFVRSSFSPSNFDDIVSDKAIVCDWSSKIQKLIENVNFKNLDPIDMSWFDPPPQKTDEWRRFIAEYIDDARVYVKFRDTALELKSRSELNDLELPMFAFAPYFLGLALAMQLAKIRFK